MLGAGSDPSGSGYSALWTPDNPRLPALSDPAGFDLTLQQLFGLLPHFGISQDVVGKNIIGFRLLSLLPSRTLQHLLRTLGYGTLVSCHGAEPFLNLGADAHGTFCGVHLRN